MTTYYICRNCGEIFEQPEERENYNTHEYWGAIETERYISAHCPECGSEDFDLASTCELCEGGFEAVCEETVCPECAKTFASIPEFVYTAFNEDSYYFENVALNPIVIATLGTDRIREILKQATMEMLTPEKAKQFALEDGESVWAGMVSIQMDKDKEKGKGV